LKTPGFRVEGGRLAIKDPEVFARDPVNLIRMFALADRRDLDLHPAALAAAGRALPLVDRSLRRDPAATRTFLSLLAQGRRPYRTLTLMSEAGVLGRFVPEFGAVTARTQLDRHHAYTVDEHTLRAVGALADIEAGRLESDHPLATRIVRRLADPEALYLAMLLHDVGKGGEGGQLVAGGRRARRAAARLGLAPERVDQVVWLVEHHLVFSDVAQRRDVSDPDTVARFAEVVGDLERLRMLTLLTVADIRSVGPGVWNGWKGQLMRELYAATEAVFRGGRGADPASAFRRRRGAAAEAARAALLASEPAAAGFAAAMDDVYFAEFGPEEHAAHAALLARAAERGAAAAVRARPERNATEAVVAAHDRPGLFADLAAALAREGAEVRGARLNTARDGQVLDVLHLQDAAGSPWGRDHPEAWARLARVLETAVLDPSPPRPAMAQRSRAGSGAPESAPVVSLDTHASAEAAIIEVSGADRPGLLAELGRALAGAGLSIVSAHVESSSGRIADAFYVTDRDGVKPEAAALEAARGALLEVLSPAGDPPPRARAVEPRSPQASA
jgi:[protein-PII] uridylyltransferase